MKHATKTEDATVVSVDGTKRISVEELDRMFDDGEDVSEFFDWSKATRPGLVPKRVNVDFPQWMVNRLDAEAARLGITRQAVIKTWIGERLGSERSA
jgi:CopG antitoxin of type II toxin-antitoxin system